MQSASYFILITFMYSSAYLSLYLYNFITPLYFKFNTPHMITYLHWVHGTVIGWGWLHNKGDYLPVQDAWGPVVGWGWWHRVQSSSLVSDDGRKTQVSVWCTPVWLCWPYCKRNTQLKQTSWGSCVADTDIIHVTILNKKQIRSILLARILPKRINAHVYMV